MATVAPDLLCLTFNGLSKTYRVAGYRSGWMVVTGPREHATGFLEGITLLASTRLCPNVPAQHAVQAALGGDPEHRRPHRPRRPAARAARRGLPRADLDPRRRLRPPRRRPVPVPAARPGGARDPRRRPARLRPAGQRAHPAGPGHRLQLAHPGPPAHRHAPGGAGPGGGHRTHGQLPVAATASSRARARSRGQVNRTRTAGATRPGAVHAVPRRTDGQRTGRSPEGDRPAPCWCSALQLRIRTRRRSPRRHRHRPARGCAPACRPRRPRW